MIQGFSVILVIALIGLLVTSCIIDWETGPKAGDRIRLGFFPATVVEGEESETARVFETTHGLAPVAAPQDYPVPVKLVADHVVGEPWAFGVFQMIAASLLLVIAITQILILRRLRRRDQ